jgi:glyoxylase-like metal-dependent hydrolase (beta-lactamase superfamily II)
MKKISILLFSFFISVGLLAGHHESDEVNLKKEQKAVLDAFEWDFGKAEIITKRVTDNIHVLFGLGGNILVSTGEDGVLLVDDQFPELKNKILRSIRKLGGRKVDYIINTHWHFDHAEGNLAFGPTGSIIVAHENSYQMMKEPMPINLVGIIYPQQPYPSSALPEITYKEEMNINLNGDRIELYHFGSAHTTGDTAVYLRDSNVIHLGDVFNIDGFPFIDADNGGSIEGMIAFCERVLEVINEDTVVVPGHGPIANTQTFKDYIKMLKTVSSRISDLIDQGRTLEEIIAARPAREWEEEKGGSGLGALVLIDRAYASLKK